MENKRKRAKIVTIRDYSLLDDISGGTIVITATQNLKSCKPLNSAKSTLSFSDLINKANEKINYKNVLSGTEFRYLIHKIIDGLFDEKKALSYNNCVAELESLYSKLILNGISETKINGINFDKYSFVERDIFEIYKQLLKKLEEENLEIYSCKVRDEAVHLLSKYEEVAFVGFVFFNDLQQSIIENIECESISFINKENDFISNELIVPLMNKVGRECQTVESGAKYENALSDLESKIFTDNKSNNKCENSVVFHEPFSNREDEFIFIAKQISDQLKKVEYSQIESEIKKYAIILTKEKESLEKTLNDAFAQYGVFITGNTKGYKNVRPVYYSKQEFLNENIVAGNKSINYIEKLQLFDSFKRIKTGMNIQVSDFPIGKFILETYKVVT